MKEKGHREFSMLKIKAATKTLVDVLHKMVEYVEEKISEELNLAKVYNGKGAMCCHVRWMDVTYEQALCGPLLVVLRPRQQTQR